jgi:hypothetical protein
MDRRTGPARWSVPDRISMVVLVVAAMTLAWGWESAALDGSQPDAAERADAPPGCTGTCGGGLGVSGDPATGLRFPD